VEKKPAPPQRKPDKEEAKLNPYDPKRPSPKSKSQDWPVSLEEFLLDPNFESCW
jgi:hypothetical protein